MINKNFINILTGLADSSKEQIVKNIFNKYKENLAVDKNFYDHRDKVKQVSDNLITAIGTGDVFLSSLIAIEAASPYSIFTWILNENYSDILIHGEGMVLTNSGVEEKVNIPDDLIKIYQLFVNHFIDNVVFIAQTKFDTGNAILDTEIGIYRFNIVHNTLNTSGNPSLVIRKQVINKSLNMGESYINSVTNSKDQIDYIQKYAFKGNTIVFGETGSGKTTLVKYMGNYKLSDKNNLITIEDTAELNIKVPLSLITNQRYKIIDLFKAALRQNPSHVIIGETRSDEIVDILQTALTTNVITTIHANTFQRAIERIIFMSLERHIDPNVIKEMINATIDCFIFMENRHIKGMWVKKDKYVENVFEAYDEIK